MLRIFNTISLRAMQRAEEGQSNDIVEFMQELCEKLDRLSTNSKNVFIDCKKIIMDLEQKNKNNNVMVDSRCEQAIKELRYWGNPTCYNDLSNAMDSLDVLQSFCTKQKYEEEAKKFNMIIKSIRMGINSEKQVFNILIGIK